MSQALVISTAAQLARAGDVGRCELIRGDLHMMSASGAEHGRVAMQIGVLLSNHVRRHGLGRVYAAETGFRISRRPDTVRAPDAAFIRAARLGEANVEGFIPIAPDLAVEVRSPEDRTSYLADKVRQWLDAGCRVVWVVDPKPRTVAVHTPDGGSRVLNEGDTLTGGGVVPGFEANVREIFA